MPRKLHITHSEFPYHITARTHAGQNWPLPINLIWSLMSDYLYFIHFAFNVRIHSFVLMSNHFHLLASTPDANLSEAMNYFMRETSKGINRMTSGEDQVYGGRYYRTLVSNLFYLNHVYKYVYRNPVEAGLSENCEDYIFSTLHGLIGRGRLTIPVVEDTCLFRGFTLDESTLQWLNTSPKKSHLEDLEKALLRKELFFPLNRTNHKIHDLNFLAF